MKTGFPCYTTVFLCNCTAHETMKRISETVAYQHNNLKIIETYCAGVQKIVLSASTGGHVYYNSFMPVATIGIREVDGKTQVSILFELKKSTKILTVLFSTFALLFEITLLALWIMNQLAEIELLFFPLGMLVFSYALGDIGLLCSSKNVLRHVFSALPCELTNQLPSISRTRMIE